jgi:hypothetical protein
VSGKPRHPPEVPGGGTEIIRELHGKIQEAKDATRELRDGLDACNALVGRLEALTGRIAEEASEDRIRSRIDSLLSDEALYKRLEPIIKHVAERLVTLGDTAVKVLEEREADFVAAMTTAAGFKEPDELVELIAVSITGEVVDAIKRIEKAKEVQTEVVREISTQLPGITALLLENISKPAPPKTKRPRGHSRNQSRRH